MVPVKAQTWQLLLNPITRTEPINRSQESGNRNLLEILSKTICFTLIPIIVTYTAAAQLFYAEPPSEPWNRSNHLPTTDNVLLSISCSIVHLTGKKKHHLSIPRLTTFQQHPFLICTVFFFFAKYGLNTCNIGKREFPNPIQFLPHNQSSFDRTGRRYAMGFRFLLFWARSAESTSPPSLLRWITPSKLENQRRPEQHFCSY